jgi:hypothetical protein
MFTIKKMQIALAAAGFALGALAGPSAGRSDGSRTLRVTQPAMLLGVSVTPADYTLRWAPERGSAYLRIELVRGKSVVAAARGHWTASEQPSPYEAFVYRPDVNGADGLAEIRFKGSADSILIDAPGTAVADAGTKAEAKAEN